MRATLRLARTECLVEISAKEGGIPHGLRRESNHSSSDSAGTDAVLNQFTCRDTDYAGSGSIIPGISTATLAAYFHLASCDALTIICRGNREAWVYTDAINRMPEPFADAPRPLLWDSGTTAT